MSFEQHIVELTNYVDLVDLPDQYKPQESYQNLKRILKVLSRLTKSQLSSIQRSTIEEKCILKVEIIS